MEFFPNSAVAMLMIIMTALKVVEQQHKMKLKENGNKKELKKRAGSCFHYLHLDRQRCCSVTTETKEAH